MLKNDAPLRLYVRDGMVRFDGSEYTINGGLSCIHSKKLRNVMIYRRVTGIRAMVSNEKNNEHYLEGRLYVRIAPCNASTSS